MMPINYDNALTANSGNMGALDQPVASRIDPATGDTILIYADGTMQRIPASPNAAGGTNAGGAGQSPISELQGPLQPIQAKIGADRPAFTNIDLRPYTDAPENAVLIQNAPDLPAELKPYVGRQLTPEQIDMVVRRNTTAGAPGSESQQQFAQSQAGGIPSFPSILAEKVRRGQLSRGQAQLYLKQYLNRGKTEKREIKKDASGRQRYVDTGDYVFPNEPTEKEVKPAVTPDSAIQKFYGIKRRLEAGQSLPTTADYQEIEYLRQYLPAPYKDEAMRLIAEAGYTDQTGLTTPPTVNEGGAQNQSIASQLAGQRPGQYRVDGKVVRWDGTRIIG